jgi:hypothetical protein
MIKNIHHSFQPTSILRNLCEQGFKALNATPKLKWKTKEPLDMFIVFAEQLSQSNQSEVIN